MIRRFTFAAAALLAVGAFGVVSVHAQQQQQQQQGQQSAIGTASVRTREGAPSVQLTNQQTPLITVAFGPQQQQSDAQITVLVSTPDQPQQDKEIVFNRAAAQHRIVAYEGEATGTQGRRLTLIAERGQENALLEPLAQNEAIMVFGLRKAEPKVAQQPQQQPQQPQQAAGAQPAQPGQPQQAAAQQPAQQTPEQAAAQQKQAADEAKRKAAEPKPDKYEAIVTVYLTTGR
jgi:hypothetical protein